jgi:predicted O-methyltransferase YrrM
MSRVGLFKRIKDKGESLWRETRLSDARRTEVMKSQKDTFERAGLSLDSAIQQTAETLELSNIRRTDTSMHYEIFAAISRVHDVKRILEIGTSSGVFTMFLAQLFTQASIQTWDLPPEGFASVGVDAGVESYRSIRIAYGDQTEKSRANLNSLRNVEQIRQDSTRLTFDSELFDLIWVDGDHTFPVVAFDIINALRLVRPQGWICVDDVRPRDTSRGTLGSQETFRTVKHLEQIGLVSLHLLMKRLDSASMLLEPESRKYVAVMRRLT